MKKLSDVAALLLMTYGARAGRVCQGRLMTLDEVARTTGGGLPAPGLISGWYLCGNLHPAMFEAASRIPLHHMGCSLAGPGDITYLVLGQQVDTWQHRFVLPLVGPEAVAYLDYLQKQPFRFSLANGDFHSTMLTLGPAHLRDIVPPDLPVHAIPEDLVGFAADTIWAAAKALEPDLLVDDGLPMPEQVCISVVQMPCVQAAFMSMDAKERGGLH